jgi:Fic family protein
LHYSLEGRTGRAILDYMLKINGFPSIYFRAVDRVSYLNALHECNYENYTPLVNLLIDRIVSTFAYTAARSTMYHVL